MPHGQRFLAAIAFGLLLDLASGSVALAQGRPAAAAASPTQPGTAPQPAVTPVPAVATAPTDPPKDVQATYRGVVMHAVSEFDAGRSAEARALFLRAHELWPSARTLRTLGMTAFDLRMYPRALEELQGALDDARRPLPDDQRALAVQGREDEELTLRLEPLASAAAPESEPMAGPVKRAIDVASSSKPNRTPAFIAFGVSAAGLAVGTVSGLIAFSKRHDVDPESGTERPTSPRQRSSPRASVRPSVPCC